MTELDEVDAALRQAGRWGMTRQTWLIVVFGLSALLFLLVAAGPLVGIAASGKVEPWALFFLAAGFFLEHVP